MRNSRFFAGIRQVQTTVMGRSVKLPCFYYDSSSMMALFPARFGALRELMPDPAYVPARVAPGVGVFQLRASSMATATWVHTTTWASSYH